ncbi:hypothetical protein [Marivirga arenosa]|uniref:Uncharacterized protein n=1 Tax=Marivirga arenosa TaxID=3059076 RepID=A0AA52EWX1_9BACT|nr:hypothetical protein [Marivirga sp. BKB1-2]WNB18170.1 hypothetical protein QYS47_29415 [Marivirga sp. BKB1-2]
MKYVLTVLFWLSFCIYAMSQTPHKMSYQAVVRNSNGELISNQVISVQISILKGSVEGEAVYKETQNPETNSNGLMSLEIGGVKAEVVLGDISEINWSNDTYFIKTETDPNGGIDYTISGTSQLLSVPYALHAKTAEQISGGINYEELDPVFQNSLASKINERDTASWNAKLDSFIETDPDFNSSIASGISEADTASWNAKLEVEQDGSIENEIQRFRVSETGDTLFLSQSNWVIISGISNDNNLDPQPIAPRVYSSSVSVELVTGGRNVTLTAIIDNVDHVEINRVGLAVLSPSQEIFHSHSEDSPTLSETDPGWFPYVYTFFIPSTAPTGDYTWIDFSIDYEGGQSIGLDETQYFFIDNG